MTWSSREKALFFSALSRHSRFRTDLIAGDVSSKSEAEVEWYLALLQSGAESVRRTDGSIVGRRDRRARWRGSHRWTEGRAGAAREVSGRWVEREEELGWAVERDLCCREGDVAAREKEESRRRERREALRAAGIARSDRSGSKIPVITFELERRWALEDWGEEVDVEKLREMDRLHIPEWSQWYRDRLDPAPKDDCPVGKKRKLKNIEDETEILQTISNIPKRLRTADDKAQLALAVNRKRSREKYRVKKLLEGGMSQGEIDLAGGADAVFALQAQEGGGEVKVKKEAPRRRELSREEDREGSRSLKSLGVDRRMQEAGWVFNYDRMAQLAQ